MGTIDAVRLFVALVSAAAIVTAIFRRVHVDHTIGLVLFGLVVGTILPGEGYALDPQLVLFVLLPGLVFEAAYRLEIDSLRRTFGGVALLAVPGVLVSTVIVAVILDVAMGLPIEFGVVVGAMVSATDPVAVIATFRRLAPPRRLGTLIEAESLFNDGTGLVVFAIAVRAVESGVSPVDAATAFVVTIVGSGIIGLVAGYLGSRILEALDDHEVEVAVSLAVAYGTYLLADSLHESGVIATVVAGVVLGNRGRQVGLGSETEQAIDNVWGFLAFLFTAFVFILIGIATPLEQVVEALPWIAWTVLAVLVGRAVVVYGLLGITSQIRHAFDGARPVPLPWLHVMFWAGLRGAVASAMALSLPTTFPNRELLIVIVFGVVLFTILVQGGTIGWVIRQTGVGAQRGAMDG